jgi:hypothetical protein
LPKKERSKNVEFDYSSSRLYINDNYISYKKNLKDVCNSKKTYFVDSRYIKNTNKYNTDIEFELVNSRGENVSVKYNGYSLYLTINDKFLTLNELGVNLIFTSPTKVVSKKTTKIIEKLISEGLMYDIKDITVDFTEVKLSKEETLLYLCNYASAYSNNENVIAFFKYIYNSYIVSDKNIKIKYFDVIAKNNGLSNIIVDMSVVDSITKYIDTITDELVLEVFKALSTNHINSIILEAFKKHISITMKNVIKNIDISELNDIIE